MLAQARVLLGRVKLGRSEKSMLLTGLRGVGKTVLLNQIERLAVESGYRTVAVEAHEDKRLAPLLAPYLRRLLFDLDRVAGAGDKVKRGLAVLRSFIGAIKLTVDDINIGLDIEPEKGAADSGDLEIDLPNLLVAVAEAALERQSAVALLIDEIQYFNSKELGALIMAMHKVQQRQLPMVLLGAGIALNCVQGRWARGILCAVLFAGALRSARGLPLMALVGLPLAMGAICQAIAEAQFHSTWLTRQRDAVWQYNLNLRAMDARFKGLAWAPLVFGLIVMLGQSSLFATPAGFPVANFPETLAKQIEALPASARIFTSDKFGGWMIYRFAGKRKVFFDGRSDYYGAQFMKDYLMLPDAKPGWETYWKQWDFTHALIPKENSLVEVLPMKGWREIGKDGAAILYEKGTN